MIRILQILLLAALCATAQTDGRVLFFYGVSGLCATGRINDASGRSQAGTVSTGVVHLGDGAYYFPGNVSNRIQLAPSKMIGSNTSWTVMTEFAVTNPAAGSDYRVWSEGSSTDSIPLVAIGLNASNVTVGVRARVGAGSQSVDWVLTNRITAGRHVLGMDFSNGTVRAWLNGAVVATSNNPSMPWVITNLDLAAVGVLTRASALQPFRGTVRHVVGFSPSIPDVEKSALAADWAATWK